MQQIKFKVIAPAQMVQPIGPIPDGTPTYMGTLMPTGQLPPSLGGALLSGGSRVGNKWLGVTYTKPPYVIPGIGEVEIV